MEEVEILGLREIQARLRQLPREIQGPVLTGALIEGGGPIRKEARALAPHAGAPHRVGKSKELVQPGNIARNIVLRKVKETDATATVSIGVRAKKGDPSKNAFYWRFWEFGTVKLAAQSFMRRAFEHKKMEAAERIKTALSRRIDAAVLKLKNLR